MRPSGKVELARANKAKVLYLLYECYEKKVNADSTWADTEVLWLAGCVVPPQELVLTLCRYRSSTPTPRTEAH